MKKIISGIIIFMALTNPALAFSDSHRLAAEKFVSASGIDQSINELKRRIGQKVLEPLKKESACFTEETAQDITQMLENYIGYEKLKPFLINLYAAEFSEDELELLGRYWGELTDDQTGELAGFYESELGKKLLEKMPILIAASSMYAREIYGKNITAIQAGAGEIVLKYLNEDGSCRL